MNKHKPYQRLLAMGLALVMALGTTPVSVSAYAATENGGEIIAFEALPRETANRQVSLGTSLEALDLPGTLNATVRVATATDADEDVQDSGQAAQEQDPDEQVQSAPEAQQEETGTPDGAANAGTDEPDGDSISGNNAPLVTDEEVPAGDAQQTGSPSGAQGTAIEDDEGTLQIQTATGSAIALGDSETGLEDEENEQPDYTELDIPVPVEWVSAPDYDGEAAGIYTFTAKITGFAVSAALPSIAVRVLPDKSTDPVIITAFDPTPYKNPDDPSTTYIAVDKGTAITDILLPGSLAATVEGGEANAYTVAVESWACSQKYNESNQLTAATYDAETLGVYLFAPALAQKENESLGDGVTPPMVEVVVRAKLDIARIGIAAMESKTWNSATAPTVIDGDTVEIQTGASSTMTVAENATVTIISNGPVDNTSKAITLNIGTGAKVVWKAEYTGTADNLITISGSGTFEMQEGEVKKTGYYMGNAIYGVGENYTVIVSGGTVSSVTQGKAIFANGTNATIIVNGGTVSSAIDTRGGATVTVSSGTVSSTTGTTISAIGNIIVSGTGKVQTTADRSSAIQAGGNVEIKDNAEVSATTGITIFAYSTSSAVSVTVSGGAVSSDTGSAIYAKGTSSTVTVSGGTVSATTGSAISADGVSSTVTVSGGTVSSTTGTTISVYGSSSTITITVTVSGGTVSATTGSAISADGGSSTIPVTVTVSGTGKVQVTEDGGSAILTRGNVEIKDNAEVSATTGSAIYAHGTSSAVNVSGGTVSSTTGRAISTYGTSATVTISDGTVSATTDKTIYAYIGNVTVSGGTVSSTAGNAIYANGTSPTVIVSGGMVSSTTGTTIYAYSGNVTVSGTGKVQATADGGSAIQTKGKVEIKDNAEVSATTGTAILADSINSTVTVSGGLVFAHCSNVTGSDGAIYLERRSSGFTGATGTGMVIAWNKAASTKVYVLRSTEHISVSPSSGATAHWSTDGTESGIAYKNGANTGFIPIDDVTVTKITLMADNFDYTLPNNHTYTGEAQGIGDITLKAPHHTYFTTETGGSWTVRYNESETPPTNAGTYEVTVEISGGTEYSNATARLGSYTIGKAPAPTIIWPTADAITYGQSLSASTPSGGSTEFGSFAWTNATAVPGVPGGSYSVTFTPNAATVKNYQEITTTTQDVAVTVNKAAFTVADQPKHVFFSDTSGQEVPLAQLVADKKLSSDTLAYAVQTITDDANSIIASSSVATDGTLSFTVQNGEAGHTATIPVKVSGFTNYNDVTINVVVTLIEKTPVIIDGLTAQDGVYNGQGHKGVTGTAISGGYTGQLDYTYSGTGITGTTTNKPITPGDYTVTVSVPASNSEYVGSAPYNFTIKKATVTIKAKDAWTYVGAAQPAYTYEASGLVGGDTLQTVPSVTCPTANMGVAGSYPIVASGAAVPNTGNYESAIIYVGGMLEVRAQNSGGGSGGYTPPALDTTTTTPAKTPNQPVTAAAPVTATAGQNGVASVSIPEKSVTDAIAKAQADAKAQGKTANGIGVSVDVSVPANTKSLTLVLTQPVLKRLVDGKVQQFEVNGQISTLSLDQKALVEIQKQSTGNVTITLNPTTAKGVRNAYDITLSYVKDGKTVNITSLDTGSVTISIPCTPGKNEAAGYFYAAYVDGKGKINRIAGSAYDANTGCVIFTATHFSVYGVGYTAPSAKFTDTEKHWAEESIDYVVGRGLLSGTSKTTFSPDTAMTREMLVTALGRLAGVDTKAYTTNSFTDVKANSAFRPYIEWAYKKGIVQGTGNSQFAPDRAVTREEIAVIFANFAKATGYTLPVIRTATTYADASGIGSTYKTVVTAMQQAGIMMGGTGNKFNPKSSATRAEVSSMLHRYIKLTIDPATAQGWALNDAGQYLYYKDSKALTGTQTIDGVKYFFNADGTLKTGWVKDDAGNWHFYSGNILLVGFWDLGAGGNNKTYYFNKDGSMVAGKWLEIGGKWYYFNADGSLAKSTKIDDYEVDENGVRKSK